MHTHSFRHFFTFAFFFAIGQSLFAAVTFTNTPTAISNTYSGTITLQIGGLTNKETVVMQKFLDLNTNSVIDGTDWLVQQFSLQDGTNFVINSVTNFNVPGDLNATTGAITAKLNFKAGDFMQNIVGKYLYKLSSPVGHFIPITNLFIVTNFPFPQRFTGNVVSNNTSTTVSNAIVLLFPPPRPGNNGPSGSPLAGAVANNAGKYTIAVPPGTYSLIAFRSNFVANLNTAPLITLADLQTNTINLSLTNASQSISGKLADASNTAIGLPGALVPVMSSSGLLAVAMTDTNGNFNARVTAGAWQVQADDTTLIVHSYLGLQNGSNVNAGATGVVLKVPKANALVYGSVKDNLGNPIMGIDVYASDNNNYLYQTDGYTDANGNYVLGVLGGLSNDPWAIQINNDSNPTNYVFSQPDLGSSGGTNIAVNTAAQINFTAILATNHISGTVKNNNGVALAGIGVWANASVNGTYYQTYTDTDASGGYLLNVADGNWNVGVNCNGGSDSLDNLLGAGTYACPNSQYILIAGNNAANNFIVQLCGGISIITPSPLPDGAVNVYYDQYLAATSCNSTFTWSVISGSIPPGLTGDPASGEIYGTPTTAGIYNSTVQVTDGISTNSKAFSITISNSVPPPPVSIAPGGGQVVVYYPVSGSNYVLETTTNLSTGPWVPATGGVPVTALTFSNTAPAAFFRLH